MAFKMKGPSLYERKQKEFKLPQVKDYRKESLDKQARLDKFRKDKFKDRSKKL